MSDSDVSTEVTPAAVPPVETTSVETLAPKSAAPGPLAGIPRPVLIGVAAVLLLLIGGVIALTGERLMGTRIDAMEIRDFDGWRVICPEPGPTAGSCALVEDVVRDGLAVVTLSVEAKPDAPLTVTVPHGVLIDPGLGFQIGSEPIRVRPYETCLVAGCLAQVTLDADTLKSLRNTANGNVVVVPGGSGMPVSIPFALKGFGNGYAELQRQQARRSSMFSSNR